MSSNIVDTEPDTNNGEDAASAMEIDSEEDRRRRRESTLAKKKYAQSWSKFQSSWLRMPDFSTWLARDKASDEKGFCAFYQKRFIYRKTELGKHSKSAKHQELIRSIYSAKKATVPINHVYPVDCKDVGTTETKLVAFLVENDLAFSLIEKLVPLVKSLPN